MVYRIGKAYGHELDQGHIREFLATVGVGLTSQYLEQFGRKLVGGLLGGLLGKTDKKMGGAATGMLMSFATTYTLGQVASRYYGSGRQMSTDLLKQTFTELIEPAKNLQEQYLPQIQEKARSLDATTIMPTCPPGQGGSPKGNVTVHGNQAGCVFVSPRIDEQRESRFAPR
jgi:uncharacterized protein (DUF697 family)